ncbi:MAG: DUF1206 domain-containing protein [Stenotrophomonas sp.]
MSARLARVGQIVKRGRKALPSFSTASEVIARFGYGARGFVYLSIGLVLMLGVMDRLPRAVGSTGAMAILAEQPFGRVWLIALGLGLWGFVGWRVLQAIEEVSTLLAGHYPPVPGSQDDGLPNTPQLLG